MAGISLLVGVLKFIPTRDATLLNPEDEVDSGELGINVVEDLKTNGSKSEDTIPTSKKKLENSNR